MGEFNTIWVIPIKSFGLRNNKYNLKEEHHNNNKTNEIYTTAPPTQTKTEVRSPVNDMDISGLHT